VGPAPALGVTPAPFEGRRVVLGVTGGIACYKAITLARELTLRGGRVDVVLTPSAASFLRPLVFEGVTGRPVLTSLWSSEGAARHLKLAQEADVVVVAPATADFLARLSVGRADDLLTTLLLATEAPIVLAPAMNDRMWANPATQAAARALTERGLTLVGPRVGPLAVGEGEGPGRMEEPEALADWVARAMTTGAPRPSVWSGLKVLVTAGPTREPVDPVRFLGNRASGKMGFALARAAWLRGAQVDLVTGPVVLPDPPGVRVHRVETALEMQAELSRLLPDADLNIFSAAVADYRPHAPQSAKVKRTDSRGAWTIDLVENPDLAKGSVGLRKIGSRSLGFALETNDLVTHAEQKLAAKELDWIVGNLVAPGVAFESDENEGVLLTRRAPGTLHRLPRESKAAMASRILSLLEPDLVGLGLAGAAPQGERDHD
jgi:phosphopantothenoylcysteine decarboxylase/phosphopantothenate--cysteine ligase